MFDEIRKGLVESYKPKPMPGTSCLICGLQSKPISLHVLEYYHDSKKDSPLGFVAMSQSGGTTRGSIPICSSCAVPCNRCGLPVATPWHKKIAAFVQAQHPTVTIRVGQGHCSHIHPLQDLLSLVKPVRVASAKPPSDHKKLPEVRARDALAELEGAGVIPAFELLKPGILELLKDKARTRVSITKDGLSPDALIYLLASNVANNMLCSGQHHIYRGVLSESGHRLLQGFTKASELMIKCEVHSLEEHERDMESLRKEIKEIG